jgi:hypothetical protein
MAQMQTNTISFHQVTCSFPSPKEIKEGVYALDKMSGNWVKIPRYTSNISPSMYSMYAPASAFPNASKYDDKYSDLVKAKDILKSDRYGYNPDNIGKAIGLIKRFLEKNAKV